MTAPGESEAVELHFDYISHNAYLAWHALRPIARGAGRRVTPVPVVFGALLKAHGQLGPAEVLPKARWMVRDVARKAFDLGLPLRPPASHPFLSLLPLRVTTLVLRDDADRGPRLIDALFDAAWGQSRPIDDPEVVAEIADAAGLDGSTLVEAAARPESKALLHAATDRAIERGVFGVPTMLADDRLFWGYDDLPSLERFLSGADPIESMDFADWWKVRPSIVRRR